MQAGVRWATERLYAALTLSVVSYPGEPQGTYIPVFGELGSTARVRFGALDVYLQVGYPHLYIPGAEPTSRFLGTWQVQFGVRFVARAVERRVTEAPGV